jgi:hypothetical protein
MDVPDFSIDTSGSPQDVQRKQALADALLKQGQDSTPAAGGKWGGALTALNRGLAGALGGYQIGQARDEEQQGKAGYQQQLAAALGAGDKVTPAAMIGLAGNPWANPAQTQAITHVADMQAQQARQGVEDKHWAASYELQKEAAARAADKTPAGFAANPDFGKVAGATQYIPISGGPADPNYIASTNAAKGTDLPASAKEYQFYVKNFQPTPDQPAPMDYGTFSTAKARAAATNVTTNIDSNSGQTYDKQLAEGLGKSHAAIANGVEDAQTRARDVAAMQGAVDSIVKNGGTTGGMGQAQIQDLKKTANSAASALGVTTPFDEKDLSDKEFLQKFNRQIAGAQAKGVVGSRVTNFEMSNYLKANPGLEMTATGNQRLLGIQAQIEQRNIAVGNAIREATAQAITQGKKIDPVTVQKIITDYDTKNHVKDPVTGQDLTQSYTLPEFQNQPGSSNPALSADHSTNMKKIGAKTYQMIDGVWHEVD